MPDGVETNTGAYTDENDTGTSPFLADTDGDSFADGFEVDQESDPTDADSTPAQPLVQPTSFTPINPLPGEEYGPRLNKPGVDYQENHYAGGTLIQDGFSNYTVHTSNAPAPERSFTTIEPYGDHGAGGGDAISGNNRPFLDGGGDNFTVRISGFVAFTEIGTYEIHLGGDDTNYFVMDTLADGVVSSQHSCCPADQPLAFTITQIGLFPFDNVFGEIGGGDWFDVGISGPGIVGTVALGDTANGSPAVYPIGVPLTDTDDDGIPDAYEEQYFPGDLTQLGTGDFDGDGVNDPEEIANETDPTIADSDMDGLTEGEEVTAGTNPLNPDSDSDGRSDGDEVKAVGGPATDPNDPDTDGDGATDQFELDEGTDPTNPNDTPGVLIVQPSFIPIGGIDGAAYVVGDPGMDYEENHYDAGVIFNNNALGNYTAHTSGTPVPIDSQTRVQPYLDHGGGGTTISNNNLPFITAGDNFTVRVTGYVHLTLPGTYQIHQGADDTNYLVMDTGDGQVIAQHNCCPQDQATEFTITAPGYFPFDNVFGEQGGGDWADLGISGPGITGTVALGDTAAGSPPVFRLLLDQTDSDGDGIIDAIEFGYFPGDLTKLGVGDFDGDTVNDPAEVANGALIRPRLTPTWTA